MGHCCSSPRLAHRRSTSPTTVASIPLRELSEPAALRRATLTVPPEIVFLILDEAYQKLPFPTRCDGLRAAALVCHAWLRPAQQLLWRSVDIRSFHQFNALRRVCEKDARGAALANQISSLALWSSFVDELMVPLTLEDIAGLLQRLPRVEELLIDRPPRMLPSFNISHFEIAAIRPPDVPQLTVLRISNARAVLIHTLLHVFSTLRFVEVYDFLPGNALFDVTTTPPPRPRCKLYELRWGFDSSLHAPHALSTSFDTLRILALRSLPPMPSLASILTPRLRSLRIYHYESVLLDAVRYCEVLEEFVVQYDGLPVVLLDALPNTLEHIGFNCAHWGDGESPLSTISTWLRGGTHARLRIATCFSPDMDSADWSNFLETCRITSVEPRFFKHPYGVHPYEFEALGEVVRFPRTAPRGAQQIALKSE